MAIYVSCRCGQAFSAEAHLAGQTVSCPACGQPLAVPGEVLAPPIAAPPRSPAAAGRHRRDNTMLIIVSVAAAAVILLLIAVAIHAVVSRAMAVASGQTAKAVPPSTTRVRPSAAPLKARPAGEPANNQTVADRLGVLGGALQGKGWRDKLVIAGGIYEIDSPHSIWIDEIYEPRGLYGPTIQGGAYVDSGCKITWAVIVKSFDTATGPVKKPNARVRTLAGMQGLEVRDKEGAHDRIQIVFRQADHMLWLTVSGRPGTVDSAATQKILGTLRRVKSPQDGLAAFQEHEGRPRP